MTGWCLLHPAGVDPTEWVAVGGRVPVTTITSDPKAALLLLATGQVDGVVLSHDWWQLDGLVVPAYQLRPEPPAGQRRTSRVRWRTAPSDAPRRPVIRDPGDLPPERRPRWRR